MRYPKYLYRVIVHPFAGEWSCGSCSARKRTVDERDEGQMSAAG